ncbi:type II toxin-antitoxin system VapB family antitoxin [Streptomyces sp. NPDC048603]|uniref:type II toxin-antitoxin system VapB family antitoxin n=1 Tax=Streptomyces sp. NPDC048603 TaxID=3365577 RepID=UPI0037224836
MSVTQIDLDDDALAEAMALSGARTKKETVNLALQEYVERRRRTEARLRHFQEARSWDEESYWRRHRAEKGEL